MFGPCCGCSGARGRLSGQLLTESVALALAGGAVGVLFAGWMLSAVKAAGGLGRTPGVALILAGSGDIRMDGGVLAFTLGLSMVTGILFGLFPALEMSRPDLRDMLRER